MKSLSGKTNPEPPKRPDFGNAPISNAKYNCEKCLLKKLPGDDCCKLKVNTLNCEIAIKRMRKVVAAYYEQKEEEEDEQTKNAKNFLNNIKTEKDEDEVDD